MTWPCPQGCAGTLQSNSQHKSMPDSCGCMSVWACCAHRMAQPVRGFPLAHEALVGIKVQLMRLVRLPRMRPPLHACRCCDHAACWGGAQRSMHSTHRCRHPAGWLLGLRCIVPLDSRANETQIVHMACSNQTRRSGLLLRSGRLIFLLVIRRHEQMHIPGSGGRGRRKRGLQGSGRRVQPKRGCLE